MDYKNTPEGKAVQSKYGKILHASRPEPPHNHPRMPMSNRAKIFSPFAALRGYEDEIASEGRDHLKGNRIEKFNILHKYLAFIAHIVVKYSQFQQLN